jgi:hypothetical protein
MDKIFKRKIAICEQCDVGDDNFLAMFAFLENIFKNLIATRQNNSSGNVLLSSMNIKYMVVNTYTFNNINVLVSRCHIWEVLQKKFELTDDEIRQILSYMLTKHCGINDSKIEQNKSDFFTGYYILKQV